MKQRILLGRGALLALAVVLVPLTPARRLRAANEGDHQAIH